MKLTIIEMPGYRERGSCYHRCSFEELVERTFGPSTWKRLDLEQRCMTAYWDELCLRTYPDRWESGLPNMRFGHEPQHLQPHGLPTRVQWQALTLEGELWLLANLPSTATLLEVS